jgi:hypothetical protein
MPSLARREHSRHALVDEVDCFERPDHHFEVYDLTYVVPFDQIDSVDQHSVDLGLEFQRGIRSANDLPNVLKARVEEYLECRGQVPGDQPSAALRRVDDWRMENYIVCEQRIQARWVLVSHKPMPGCKGMISHFTPYFVGPTLPAHALNMFDNTATGGSRFTEGQRLT